MPAASKDSLTKAPDDSERPGKVLGSANRLSDNLDPQLAGSRAFKRAKEAFGPSAHEVQWGPNIESTYTEHDNPFYYRCPKGEHKLVGPISWSSQKSRIKSWPKLRCISLRTPWCSKCTWGTSVNVWLAWRMLSASGASGGVLIVLWYVFEAVVFVHWQEISEKPGIAPGRAILYQRSSTAAQPVPAPVSLAAGHPGTQISLSVLCKRLAHSLDFNVCNTDTVFRGRKKDTASAFSSRSSFLRYFLSITSTTMPSIITRYHLGGTCIYMCSVYWHNDFKQTWWDSYRLTTYKPKVGLVHRDVCDSLVELDWCAVKCTFFRTGNRGQVPGGDCERLPGTTELQWLLRPGLQQARQFPRRGHHKQALVNRLLI